MCTISRGFPQNRSRHGGQKLGIVWKEVASDVFAFNQPGTQCRADPVTGEVTEPNPEGDLISAVVGVVWNDHYATMTGSCQKGEAMDAGRLFYPDEATVIMTECWNHFEDLSASPGFSQKSLICQQEMLRFSDGFRRFVDHETWQPQLTAEAPEKSARIAEDAAVSQLRTIPDGPNQWEVHRERAVSQSSLGAAMVGTELVTGTGLTGTCVP
jgi:hypothetical protein